MEAPTFPDEEPACLLAVCAPDLSSPVSRYRKDTAVWASVNVCFRVRKRGRAYLFSVCGRSDEATLD